MNYFDDENKIIECFQGTESTDIFFPVEKNELFVMFESIYDEGKWKLWKNSSGKSDPPPDFYCDEFKLMMDVMRVDDHAHKNKKGKIVNPTNARESQIQKELREKGIYDTFPNVENIIVCADTGLPTEQDHNYDYYRKNFIRILEEHKRKIELYKQNHPGFKIVFFVLDESSAYTESVIKPQKMEEGMPMLGRPHFWFFDKSFLQVFMNSSIDYLIWYAPYKQEHLFFGFEFPEVVVYDTKLSINDCIEYDAAKMISCEE